MTHNDCNRNVEASIKNPVLIQNLWQSGQHEDGCPPATDASITLASSPDSVTRPLCPVCNAMVATQNDLRLHMAAHSEPMTPLVGIVKGYSCRICNKVLSSPSSLDRHLQSHSGTRPFQCPVCNVGFTTIPNMQRHMRKLHTDTNTAGCSSGCSNADSDDSSAGSSHKRPRIDDDEEAPLAFASGEPAAAAANGSPHTPPPTPTPSAGRVFNCPVCHVNMLNLVDLETHLNSMHTDYMEFCDECGESFKNVRELNLHRYAAHRAKSRGDRDIVGFKDLTFIDFSSSKFPQIARAECEKSLHRAPNGPHQFPCECGRAFPCDEALVIHRKECPLSVYSPEGPADLRQRQTSLEDGDSRQDFFRKLDLTTALPQYKTPAERELAVANAIVRPASPEEEQDPFLSDFRRMKKRGEFPCRLCSKVYPNLRALKGHCRYHAPVGGRYRCNMCRFEVPDKATLQRHIRTHNGARPFECRECNFGFTTKANCERHLRNRHQKSDRKDLEESTLYHKHEDPNNDPDEMDVRSPPANTKAMDVKRTLFPEASTTVQASSVSPERRQSLDVATMTSDDEEPFVEEIDNQPLDLSTRRPTCDDEVDDAEPQDLSMGCCRSPAPGDTAGVAPILAPPPPPPPMGAFTHMYANAAAAAAVAAAAAGGGYPPYRLPLPQHAFGLQPYYGNLFGSPLPLGLLHGQALLAASTASPAMPTSLTPQRCASPALSSETNNSRVTPPLEETPSRSTTLTAVPQHSPAQSTASTSTSSVDSKMVLKNGVFVPKQKQVRYRTERPFGCNFCASRFTLSSNRERHIKHQHPDLWSHRHRRALTGRRRSTELSDLPHQSESPGSPASPRSPPSSPRPAETAPSPSSAVNCVTVSAPRPASPSSEHLDDVKLPIVQQVKTKLEVDNDQETEADELVIDETEASQDIKPEVAAPGAPTQKDEGVDLASVSRLLDNAQTQTFRQFFRDGEENPAPVPTPAEGPSEEDEGVVSASHSEGNNSASDGNRSEGESAPQRPPKKKSAYSLAPNRVKCTYCGRMFPWSSSLRRHILTHTGQKPFSCRFCPLLFTTKSNCDRHLARKHRDRVGELRQPNASRKERPPRSSGSSASPASSTSSEVSPSRSATRPHRCLECSGSSFASLSKLKRHMASKHGQRLSPQATRSGYESTNSEEADDGSPVAVLSDTSLTPKTAAPLVDATPLKSEQTSPIAADLADDVMSSEETGRSLTSAAVPEPRSPPPERRSTSPLPNSTATTKIATPGELPFKCHLCQGSFAKPNECVDHLRTHHEDEFEVLKSKGLLKGFDESADDDGIDYTQDRDPQLGPGENLEQLRGKFPDYANRKVRCACCMRRFWSAEDLRRHMRTHTGAKPYACSVCQRCFTLKHSMVRHQRKHKENNNDSDTSNNNIPMALHSGGSTGETSPRPTSVDNTESVAVPMDLAASRALPKNGLNVAVGQVVVAFKENSLQRSYLQDEGDSGLIGNLLGIRDPSLIDRMLLSKSANDAEELLGVKHAARS